MAGKDYLSQEEIDALLEQTNMDSQASGHDAKVDHYLTSLQQDALGEIGNITFGSAATALSTLLGKKVDITTPKVTAIARKELELEFPIPHVAVHVKYVNGFEGVNLLVIRTEDAKVIADLMLGGDGAGQAGELKDIHISAVQEAMNQMMGSSATSMSTIFNRFVNISPPGIDILDFTQSDNPAIPKEDVFIKVAFRLTIENLIDSSIMQLLPLDFAQEMVNSLLNAEPDQDSMEMDKIPSVQPPSVVEPTLHTDSPQTAAELQVSASAEQPAPDASRSETASYGSVNQGRNVNVQPAQYTNFGNQPQVFGESNLSMLLDIPLRVTVELGRTERLIKDILELSQGSIIELDKLAGEPVDILVNNKLIAKGEVVVIDENFGVRVTDIISQEERVHKLQ